MKRYACHRYYETSDRYQRQAVVTVDESGKVVDVTPLVEETRHTEWLGGIIWKDEEGYAWHLSDYDFEHECRTPQSIRRKLT